MKVLLDIIDERKRQDKKWGTRKQSGLIWLTILVEEVGEVAKAWLEGEYVRPELIHVAAVVVAWVENLDYGSADIERNSR